MAVDRILIDDLQVHCVIGVHDWERSVRQKLLICVELLTSLKRAGEADDLNLTIDYARVAADIEALAESGKFQLIEALAEAIATHLLEQHTLPAVRIRVRKPAALSQAASVGVAIERSRKP
ncbi:MAG: dihydroneopterin aldolase [Pseudomonadales bacterium]